MKKVFVYGSLKQGFGNHRLLEGSKYLGEAVTKPEFTMYDLGAFPAITRGGSSEIHGEVYEVDDNVFQRLDALEGYPNFYDRMQIETPYGEAWVYFVDKSYNSSVIETGVW